MWRRYRGCVQFTLGDNESRFMRIAKRAVLVLFVLHVPIWISSTYRAWVQIYRLDLEAPDTLRVGAAVTWGVVSSGRTEADARAEIIQGGTRVLLGEIVLNRNWDAAYDFRSRSGTRTVLLTREMLAGFVPGPAILHGSAVGRPQWMRVPPPTLRDQPVILVVAADPGTQPARPASSSALPRD